MAALVWRRREQVIRYAVHPRHSLPPAPSLAHRMQSSRLDHEPLLPGRPDAVHAEHNGQDGNDHDIPNARQAYQRGALHGMSALAVQVRGGGRCEGEHV